MKIDCFLIKYLGTLISPKILHAINYNYLIDRINTKLNNWNRFNLSQAGRIILLRSVLNAMPLHAMCINWIPNVIDKINSILKNFLRSNDSDKRGLHLVVWEKVIKLRMMEDWALGI
ncbi:ribonuclease H protein [Canna indica]|uniref:Ribonuclease H protein n=1 Tax=Canna indica TaxID=4628 RepID=A0AAQ3Q0R5_9LILI|nr:ribonuclease H protein [Canna indica]